MPAKPPTGIAKIDTGRPTGSRVISTILDVDLEGTEETEIAAQISLPQEGGWGWVVVAASFINVMILDGIVFTFGSLLQDVSNDLNAPEAVISAAGSVKIAVYYITSPVVSALINRFGFRTCAMSGSITCALALMISYFANNCIVLIIFYGVIHGFGCSLLSMSSNLIVGFYFEKFRAIAISITAGGSSFGIMGMYPLNTYLVSLSGWRSVTLLHSGLSGLCYFTSFVFRPLLSLTVMKTEEDPTRTVTYLPNLAANAPPTKGMKPTVTEKFFAAVSNVHFPTAAAVVEEGGPVPTPTAQPGTSTSPVSKLTLVAISPQDGISRQQMRQVQSMVSTAQANKQNIEITVQVDKRATTGICGRCCRWESEVAQARPMYRDDAFYDGKIEKLPAFQKSVLETDPEARTGLEYQLAVSRAITVNDLKEKKGVFTTAVRRVLATMMDPGLLKRHSFVTLAISGFIMNLGCLVPYVYLHDRNERAGIDPSHCSLFISCIGLANAIGRIIWGALATKYNPVILFVIASLIAGISTMVSNMSYNLNYQYFYCILFGCTISAQSGLRSVIIVALYTLEKLTNATGMLLLFVGLGNLFCLPLASILREKFGYDVAFYLSGAFMTIGGIIVMPTKYLHSREEIKLAKQKRRRSSVVRRLTNS